MRLLDLFCGAGGAAVGYHRAGFAEIVGVDIRPQPRYPFAFVQADAMAFPLEGFDVIHASPPCEAYTRCTPREYRGNHPDLIDAIRTRIRQAGTSYVIENVPDARHLLNSPFMLCGTMFGLPLLRHRYFEVEPQIFALLPACGHPRLPIVVTGTTRRKTGRLEYKVQDCRDAMDVQWMVRTEIDKAIPPAFTEYIGRNLLSLLGERVQ